jgi:hypothetical protein
MRFHALTDNTSNYLPMHASNNFPYGAPPKLEDNEMDYGEPTQPSESQPSESQPSESPPSSSPLSPSPCLFPRRGKAPLF